ncbi:hypothetical protein E2P81_ATG06178 [Venturia nashicola]|nr:hypothetical protein E2P81_ATG06178 [Venturia nashicola]
MANWNDLPLELRVKIYNNLWRFEDSLVVPQAIHMERASKTPVRTRSQAKEKLDPASPHNPWKHHAHIVSASSRFLRCSKQVYVEGMTILYGNRFTANHLDSFPAFAKKVGPFSFVHIRHLELDYHVFSDAYVANQFDGLVHLETLKYHQYHAGQTSIRPIPAHVPIGTSDPLFRTRSARPSHIMNDFLGSMASRHPHAKITIELTLFVTDTQPGGPHLDIREHWNAKYTIHRTGEMLDVIYTPGSGKSKRFTSPLRMY